VFDVKRTLLVGVALIAYIESAEAKEIVLKCKTLHSNTIQELAIDLDSRQLAFGKEANGTANLVLDILKINDKVVTAVMSGPILKYGEQLFVLNRETGLYVMTTVSLTCTDKKCSSQKGPTVDTYSGTCWPPIF
jgi:hypothetical protein